MSCSRLESHAGSPSDNSRLAAAETGEPSSPGVRDRRSVSRLQRAVATARQACAEPGRIDPVPRWSDIALR